jgi:hypothetical protein
MTPKKKIFLAAFSICLAISGVVAVACKSHSVKLTLVAIVALLITTSFASSSSLAKEVDNIFFWNKVTKRPVNEYPQTKEQRQAVRPELYIKLDELVRKFIAAKSELADYISKNPNEPRINPSVTLLKGKIHEAQVPLMNYWSLLVRLELLPVDSDQGIKWETWNGFVRSVLRNESILEHMLSESFNNNVFA